MTGLRDHEIDTVTAIRGGNAIWPGLWLFTGFGVLIHAGVRVGGGESFTSPGVLLGAGALLAITVFGASAMARRRYVFVTIDTTQGQRRLGGLTRAARAALPDEAAQAGAHRG